MKKRFCVAYINFFDNELRQSVVMADNEINAIYEAGFATSDEIGDCCGIDEVKQYFFNCDAMVSVIEV